MGNTESNQESKSGRNADFLNNYFIVKKLVDQKFGECTILQDKQNSQQCIMRELNSTDLEDHRKEQKKFEDRIKFSNPNIVRLLGFFEKQESQFCSTFYKSYLIFEYLNNSLEQEFSIRRQQQQSFSEQELWSLLTGSVLGLLYLQKNNITNQNLKPSTIYIDNEGIVKIMDPAFFNQINNFATILTNKTGSFKSIYLAPALLSALENENWQPIHDPYKSDVFTLGMIILHASLMENLDSCYKYENFQLKKEVLQNKLQKLSENFSQEFCNIIMVMLRFDQDERPNFYQLEDYFNKLQVFQQSPEKQLQQLEKSQNKQQFHHMDDQNFQGKKSHKQQVQPQQPQQYSNLPEFDSSQLQNSQFEQIKRHNKNLSNDGFQVQKPQRNNKVLEDISSYSMNKNNQCFAGNLKKDLDDVGSQINYIPIDQSVQLAKPDENIADQFDMPSARDNLQNDNPQYQQEGQIYSNDQFYQSQVDDKENYQNQDIQQSQYQLSYNHKYEQKYEQNKIQKDIYVPELVSKNNYEEENIQLQKFQKNSYYVAPLLDKTNQTYTKSYQVDKKYETQLDIEEILKKYTVKDDKPKVYEPNENNYKQNFKKQEYLGSQKKFKDPQFSQIQIDPKEYTSSYFKQSKVQDNNQKSNHSPQFQNQDYLKDYKIEYQKNENFQYDKDTTVTDKNQESIHEQEEKVYSDHPCQDQQPVVYQSEQQFQQNNQYYDQKQDEYQFEQNFNSNQNVQEQDQYEDQYEQQQQNMGESNQSHTYQQYDGYKEDVIENYQNGSRYEGEKVNDMRHGVGKFFYQDGGLYDGEWKENKMHGKGILYYASGTPAYDGEWFEDKFEGFGVLYNENPEEFNEPFDYNDFDLVEELWERYDGEFRDDNKEGYGTLYLSNGEKFQGTFKQDIINGSGTFYKLDGTSVEGIWMNNKLTY